MFTYKRLLYILVLAVSFWSSGVFLLRAMASYQAWGGLFTLCIFLISLPVSFVCISPVKKLLGLTKNEVLPAIILLTSFVALLHGSILTLYPTLYGDEAGLLPGSIWLIWFCGLVMISAVFHTRK